MSDKQPSIYEIKRLTAIGKILALRIEDCSSLEEVVDAKYDYTCFHNLAEKYIHEFPDNTCVEYKVIYSMNHDDQIHEIDSLIDFYRQHESPRLSPSTPTQLNTLPL